MNNSLLNEKLTSPPYILETERLRLRELQPDDSDFIVLLVNSPGWLRFIGDRNIRNRAQGLTFLEEGPLKSYRELGFGMYLVETKAGGNAAGVCGIHKRPGLDCPDLGFAFLPGFSGQGFAYEIASATLRFVHDELRIRKIYAIVLPENERSVRLLQKLGMKPDGQYISPAGETLLRFMSERPVTRP